MPAEQPAEPPYELFDCLQVNLAVLADLWHGAGAHLALGTVLRFRPMPGANGLPTVETSAERQLAEAEGRLGLIVRERRRELGELSAGEMYYVLADAYHLPWVPYYGRQHMEHSFLLEPVVGGRFTVIDGYHNETPWGSARPGRWELDSEGLAAAMPADAQVVVLKAGPRPVVGPRPAIDLAGPDEVEKYAAAYAEHPDRLVALRQLTLETWLLSRSRRLHTRLLSHLGEIGNEAAIDEHVRAWQALTEQCYLASRRVERGRREPQGLYARVAARLHADRTVFGQATCQVQERNEVRRAVAAVVAEILGVTVESLLGGQPLTAAATFSSFRVVEIVERLESQMGVEFLAEDLVPENLHHLDDICRIIRRPLPTSAVPAASGGSGG